MEFTATPEHGTNKGGRRQLAKRAVLLIVSIGLFVIVETFSPVSLFEPQSDGWILWFSYANDLILPFAFYFFLCIGEKRLRTWHLRAFLAFAIPSILELGQLLYYPVAGGYYIGAFDPLDIVMYAIGVALAAMLEQRLFPKLFRFW